MLGRPINIQVPLPKVWLATASGHLVHQLRGRAQLQLWRHAMIRKVHHYVASDLNDQHFLGDQSSIIGQAFQSQYSLFYSCLQDMYDSNADVDVDANVVFMFIRICRFTARIMN